MPQPVTSTQEATTWSARSPRAALARFHQFREREALQPGGERVGTPRSGLGESAGELQLVFGGRGAGAGERGKQAAWARTAGGSEPTADVRVHGSA
ncbi:hypothetical protein [Streptomyces thinghirensis]|uniref:Uncharacterized protein n=1 Tax=Streptomyces thinghirensis TaxID=551547 RepID=A0ABP9T439_9ACTN